MYIEDWNAFFQQAEELVAEQPLKTRYTIKYRHSEGKLVLKVTDDRTCLKYKTDQLADLKKVEKLNNLFFAYMSRGEAAHEEVQELSPSIQQASTSSQNRKSRKRG